MTIALEQLADGSVSDRNFQTLARLVLDTGGRSIGIRWGTATLTWPGGTTKSAAVTVSHGLGRTPTVVLVSAATLNGGNETLTVEAGTYTSSQFTAQAAFSQGFTPGAGGTETFAWVVIG